MTFNGFFKWFLFILIGLLVSAEDEPLHLKGSFEIGEVERGKGIVEQGLLDEKGEAVYQVYADGDIAIATDLGEIALFRTQAYALLEVLYQQRDRLRGTEDTLPLEELPVWARPEEE